MSAEDVTKRCYVCNAFFDDRVKLGMHISACYNEAVNVRKELWHPHPLDLVDQQHYTQYMANKHKYTIAEMKDAKKRGISFVTADSFDAVKGNLKNETPHHQNVAQPARTGVTMLKNELSSEIGKLRELREEEERRMASQEDRFERMCNAIESKAGGGGAPNSHQRPPVSQQRNPVTHQRTPDRGVYDGNNTPVVIRETQQGGQQRPPSGTNMVYRVNGQVQQGTGATFSPIAGAVPQKHAAPAPYVDRPPMVSVAPGQVSKANVNKPRVMDDGRIECPVCRKLFGRRGYEAHSKRCGLDPENDFTHSQDARLHEEKAGRMKVTEQVPSSQEEDKWTQYMMTYPRPILEESPSSPGARSKAAEKAAQKREMDAMIAREMARPTAGARSKNQ